MLLPYFQSTETIECGVDEAGRGCLCGAVVAAAVILPKDFQNQSLNDSKQLNPKQRKELREIIEKEAVAFGVGFVSNEEIDQINILNASFLAMTRAIEQIKKPIELLLIDGNRFRSQLTTPYKCIVKGDAKYSSIAAASILAKTYRDEYMETLAKEYPEYNWQKNKGYPTKEHREAIKQFGVTPHHRKTFNLLGELSLFED
ncbi:MAG: ribonuclease HII [Bacteroidales bacterium]|jgi:ribonuclease HII|nr:ribonuclease HII [Bacteroidales bacterium]MDD4703622.1 ribonuclease HII [Bacteroidales bacterium]